MEQPSTSAAAEDDGKPACFIITHSVAKKHNIGTIARCATAFGVKEVRAQHTDLAKAKPQQYHSSARADRAKCRARWCLRVHLELQVCLSGDRHYNTFGSHGADAHVAFRSVHASS